jgi:2-hydroxy-6-oxonona-2,4-dienedioate hydrolase
VTLWTDFLGAELRRVDVAGVATRVATLGAGEPALVLLHGRGGHLEAWSANVGPLAERHSVVAFDLLGHGLTAGHDGGYAVDDLATLDALGLRRSVLVGQSIGGWVAARVALRRPELVESLVLVEPAGLQSEEERLADPTVAAQFARGGRAFDEPSAEAVRDRLAGLFADPAHISDELVETRRRLYAPPAAGAVHKAVRAADNDAALLTPSALERLGVPVLLIHGAEANTPATVIERAATAAGARLVTLERARQWPQLERADAVNALIRDFVSTPGGPQ